MFTRGLSLALKLALLSGAVVGCSDLPSEKEMRALVIDAATVRERDFIIDPNTTPLTDIAHRWVYVFDRTPCALFNETPEFELSQMNWCFGQRMFPELERSRSTLLSMRICNMLCVDCSGILFERHPSVSIISEDNITGLGMTTQGDSIVGTVSFERPDCFRGAIDFVARKGPAGWRVEEFRMPVMGLYLKRIGDTSWRPWTPSPIGDLLPTCRTIDRESLQTVRISSNGESLRVEVEGRGRSKQSGYPQAMQRYLVGKTVRVLADENVTAGQVFEVLDKLRSLSVPGAGFYLASESGGPATILVDSVPILVTSGTPVFRGQLGDIIVARMCLADSSISVSAGLENAIVVEDAEETSSFIIRALGNEPELPFFLAVAPNTPASLVVMALDQLAAAKAKRVIVGVDSNFRGVLFELVGANAEE